jgi:hypothetical protein
MVAIGLLNSVLFLVLLNLFLYPFMRRRLPVEAAAEPVSIIPGSVEKTHPGWREEDLKILLTESPGENRSRRNPLVSAGSGGKVRVSRFV